MKLQLKTVTIPILFLAIIRVVDAQDFYKRFHDKRFPYRYLKHESDKNFIQEIIREKKWIKLKVNSGDRPMPTSVQSLPDLGEHNVLPFDKVFVDPYWNLASTSEKKAVLDSTLINSKHIRNRVREINQPDLAFWYSLFNYNEVGSILSTYRYINREPAKIQIQVPYFGKKLLIAYNQNFPTAVEYEISKETLHYTVARLIKDAAYNISVNAWIEQVNLYAQAFGLNDWARYKLFAQSLTQIYSDQEILSQKILLGYALMVSGYDVKYAYRRKKFYVLLPTDRKIYDSNYVEIGGKHYYILDSSKHSKLYVLDYTYRKDNRIMDLSNPLPFSFERKKTAVLPWGSKSLKLVYNETVANFYKDYPDLGTQIRLYTPFSELTKQFLMHKFIPSLEVLETDQERINYLLKFVQTIFEPDTQEPSAALFAEQVLGQTHVSVESRVAFFIQLLRTLLDLPVLAFTYADYMLVGVHVPDTEIKGFRIHYEGKPYMVCDPNRLSNIGLMFGGFEQ